MTDVVHPYQLDPNELDNHLENMVQVTFDDLTSQFMLLPRGRVFLEYDRFAHAYEGLRIATDGFRDLRAQKIWPALERDSAALIVLRTVLGVSPPEWQDLAAEETGVSFSSNWTRSVDGRAKGDPQLFASDVSFLMRTRVDALLEAARVLVSRGAPEAPEGLVHRLEKVDTEHGLQSLEYTATYGVPYPTLLYERYLGRPFASHRDAVSERVGDVMESAIEDALTVARVPFRKTSRAERVPGFAQAPDFFAPNEYAPTVIIEAKITGDDGTARDKVSRVLRLASMRDERLRSGRPSFEVVACIDGRGFGVRRQDMRDLLLATNGKVFTAATLGDLVAHTDLAGLAP